jgi:hypothetical protein
MGLKLSTPEGYRIIITNSVVMATLSTSVVPLLRKITTPVIRLFAAEFVTILLGLGLMILKCRRVVGSAIIASYEV